MNQTIRHISHGEIEGYVGNIIRHIQKDNIRVKAVVGIVRGGLIPAVMLSHYFKVPMYTIDYSLRDRNASILQDEAKDTLAKAFSNIYNSDGEKDMVLVIDDINDSGATLKGIYNFLYDELMVNESFIFAALLEKCTSAFDCNYYGEMITDEDNDWYVFPYEQWWMNSGNLNRRY